MAATVARSGEKINVIPEDGELSVDVRVWSVEEGQRVARAIRGYRPADTRGSRWRWRAASIGRRSSRRRTPSRSTSGRGGSPTELGFALGAARVGGASDGNFTAAAGIPTLDGLGPKGGGRPRARTSSCRSRIFRGARPCSPRWWRAREPPRRPRAPRARRFRRGAGASRGGSGASRIAAGAVDLRPAGRRSRRRNDGRRLLREASSSASSTACRGPTSDGPAITPICWRCGRSSAGRGVSVRLKFFQRPGVSRAGSGSSRGPTTRSSF